MFQVFQTGNDNCLISFHPGGFVNKLPGSVDGQLSVHALSDPKTSTRLTRYKGNAARSWAETNMAGIFEGSDQLA